MAQRETAEDEAGRLLAEMAKERAAAAAVFASAQEALSRARAAHSRGERAPGEIAALSRAKKRIHQRGDRIRGLQAQLHQVHEERRPRPPD